MLDVRAVRVERDARHLRAHWLAAGSKVSGHWHGARCGAGHDVTWAGSRVDGRDRQ